MAWDFFACNYEDHRLTRDDEGSITAVEMAAIHPELALDEERLGVGELARGDFEDKKME